MQAEAFQRIHPKEYHKKFLEKQVRPDGRGLTKCRKTTVIPGSLANADGSALAKIGNTTVLCGLKLEVGIPQATKPKAGRLEVGVHLSPLCSPKFSVGRATEQAIALGECLHNVTVSTGVLDLNELCITAGSSVWVVYADLVCLDFDGNALDACFLALNAALRHLRLPETVVDDAGLVSITDQRVQKLTVAHTPIALTFGFIDDYVICDPTGDEEDLLSGTCTIVYNDKGALCGVYKPGGEHGLTTALLRGCMDASKKRAAELAPQIAAAHAAQQQAVQTAATASASVKAGASASAPAAGAAAAGAGAGAAATNGAKAAAAQETPKKKSKKH